MHFSNILSPSMLFLLPRISLSNLALIEMLQPPGLQLVLISTLLNLCLCCTLYWHVPVIYWCLQIHLHKQLFWHIAFISLEPLLTQAQHSLAGILPASLHPPQVAATSTHLGLSYTFTRQLLQYLGLTCTCKTIQCLQFPCLPNLLCWTALM